VVDRFDRGQFKPLQAGLARDKEAATLATMSISTARTIVREVKTAQRPLVELEQAIELLTQAMQEVAVIRIPIPKEGKE